MSAPTKSEAPDELPQIGQYQLVQQIGKGGMGVVFRAQHLRLKRWVALKLLSDRRLIDSHAVARFEREMETVGRLDHANIVRATDAGYADGYHYIAMELIDGLDFSQLVRERGELSVSDACELVRSAAMGLHHAHENNLVHRDVKPNNLMLSAQGVVKVLDLGLARLTRAEQNETLTGTGAVIGTPDYMAPEQWDSNKDVDARTDVYGLGCTLYTLFAKRPPFSGNGTDSASQKMAAHLQTPPPQLGTARPDVPTGVQAVIDRAMAKEPSQRFQKAIELADALSEFARGANLAALARVTTSATPGTTDPAMNGDRGQAATVSHTAQPTPQTADRTRVAPESGRWKRIRGWLAVGTACLAIASVVFFATRGSTEKPQEPSGPPQAPPKPKPNEWFNLLTAEPTKAVWPQGQAETDSNLWFEGPKRDLWVKVNGRAMVQLGEIDNVDFELECQIAQTPWLGNVGVYFGDRPVEDGHEAISITLNGFGYAPNMKPTLQLSPVRHIGKNSDTRQIIGSSPVSQPTKETCKFWLAVYQTGVYKVQWEGHPEPVQLLAADKILRPRATGGGLGLFAQNTTSQFRNVRLRILPPPTP